MSFIERTWGCQNTACGHVFIAHARYPACPHCGCVRVAWVPVKVNVGKVAGGVDAELRTLADLYGLSDLNSPSPSRQPQAKKLATAVGGGQGGVVAFNGFAASINPQAARSETNQSGAQCLPTVNRVNAKVRAGMDQKLTGQLGLGSIAANTEIIHRHRGQP